MKKILLSIVLLSAITIADAKNEKVYVKGGYKLTLTNNDATLDTAELTRLVKTFFTVYPQLAAEYNPGTLKEVTMAVDTAYKGVAATADGKVTIASSWLHKRPEDIDVVTHEVMHIVQDYGESVGPGWLTEGIADYARNKFGVNNTAAKWSLPEFKPTQNYDNAYRVTARFLYWIEEKKKPGIVKELDSQLRKHTYTDNAWKQLTGKTVDELWKEYAANPAI
ncbi:basic secretory protein-like protein [Mucilaginibacter sp. L3T2-6]|uniref:basic secretory protein-like protein n=1 Tax=Mucilaginibacter sp. L3T2-6 TaxID=3062491 RepID=UPI002675AC12|nr:basic secretory protein-like protein [Mucilaginibacter sp. L3T2-6]MDO3644785.1 basic secretory protein-like protein [Mucilaginibacter sp. L3T2-6]MDV6217179.1 basic secretory protein-like protein [Mucilaginibacter sp. L3T2-6]